MMLSEGGGAAMGVNNKGQWHHMWKHNKPRYSVLKEADFFFKFA